MKPFYQSKEFWMYVGAIITSTASIFTGEKTLQVVLPAIIIDVFGILGIVFRWNSPERPLGWKR